MCLLLSCVVYYLLEDKLTALREVLSSVMAGGQPGGGAGAVWFRRRCHSGSHPGLRGALEDGERQAAPAAALCLSALPQLKRRLSTSSQLNAAAPA